MTTETPRQPVVVEGVADLVTDHEAVGALHCAENEKYNTDYSVDFLDPDVNATFQVVPSWAFSLTEDDFEGSPTRWSFDG